MPKRKSVSREAAILNVRLWTVERGWTLAQCADALGMNLNTLKGWMVGAGYRYTIKAAVWMPVSAESDEEKSR